MKKTTSLFLFLILISFLSYSQKASKDNAYYNSYDDLVSVENSGLYLGTEYLDNFRITEENYKFFESYEFLIGSLDYNGQTYYDKELKYNVFDDELLIKLKTEQGETLMRLIRDKIAGFIIGEHHFVKINAVDNDKQDMSGFYEELEKNDITALFKKYGKKKLKKLDRNIVYYEYKDQKNRDFLYYNKNYYRIKSSKDFEKIFPQYKNEIKEFSDRKKKSSLEDKIAGLTILVYRKLSN